MCNSRQSWSKGVFVEGYWAKNSRGVRRTAMS